MRRSAIGALALALLGPPAAGVELAVGDAVVVDPDRRGVFVLDLGTGATTPISLGGSLVYPSGVAVDAAGRVFVADPDANAIFQVDPADGTQTLLCQGGELRYPTGVAWSRFTGNLLVADPVANAVFVLEPGTCTLDVLLSGPPMRHPSGVREELDGDVLVVDPDVGGVLRFLAGPPETVSEGGLLRSPRGVALDGEDRLIVDPVSDGVVRLAGGVQSFEVASDSLLFPSDLEVLPEPAGALPMASGVALLLGLRRRRG